MKQIISLLVLLFSSSLFAQNNSILTTPDSLTILNLPDSLNVNNPQSQKNAEQLSFYKIK